MQGDALVGEGRYNLRIMGNMRTKSVCLALPGTYNCSRQLFVV